MKKKLLTIISTISLALMLVLTPILSTSVNTSSVSENLDARTRTVSASSNQVDLENAFNEFEEGTLTITEETVSLEGIKTFKLSDFSEFDLVADSDVDEEVARIKYNVDYNNQTNEITLSITLADETQNIDDKLVGYAFVNEAGNIDVIFDCDGETIYLSELQELGMIENCGFFSRLVKSVKKAVSTTAGKIITVAAAAACVAVGVVGAIVAAPVVAVVAVGAVVGAVGLGASAAISTSITDGEVDWQAVLDCVGVGAVAGGVIAGLSYGATKLIMTVAERAKVAKSIENIEPNRQNHILQQKHNWDKIGSKKWDKNVKEAIKYTVNHGTEASYKDGVASILTATYQDQKVQVVVKIVDGILKIVDAWIC